MYPEDEEPKETDEEVMLQQSEGPSPLTDCGGGVSVHVDWACPLCPSREGSQGSGWHLGSPTSMAALFPGSVRVLACALQSRGWSREEVATCGP